MTLAAGGTGVPASRHAAGSGCQAEGGRWISPLQHAAPVSSATRRRSAGC